MTTQRYDAVVIGAGQGGVPLARTLAQGGRRTALIEREHVGGTCYNEGCTPTKTMVASAKVAIWIGVRRTTVSRTVRLLSTRPRCASASATS